ncbi:hypothetical protein ACROYT_G022535 [Oculina patagonica]
MHNDHVQNSGKVPRPSDGATKNASVTPVHTDHVQNSGKVPRRSEGATKNASVTPVHTDHVQNSGKVPRPSEGATKNASVTPVHTGGKGSTESLQNVFVQAKFDGAWFAIKNKIDESKLPNVPDCYISLELAMNQLTTQRKEISREEDATSVRQAQTRNLQESRQSMAVFFVMSAYVVMGVTTFTTAATNR